MIGVHEKLVMDDVNMTLVQLNQTEVTKYLPVTITLVVIMCIGILGNILVLFIYKFKFKQSSARVYILSLALADLTVCIFGIPYHVLDLTLVLIYTNVPLCKAFSYFMGACTQSSIFILLVVGLDRYLKICRPLKKQIVDFGDRKACGIAVAMAMVLSVPNGIIYGHSTVSTGVNNFTGTECFIDDRYQGSWFAFGFFGFIVLIFLVLVILLISMYALICHTIYKNDSIVEVKFKRKAGVSLCCRNESRDKAAEADIEPQIHTNFSTSAEITENRKNERKHVNYAKHKFVRKETIVRHSWKPDKKAMENNTRKITLMMMTITIVFVIAYLPFIVISMMDNLDGTFWEDLTYFQALMYDFLLRIYLINHTANPVIYSFWDDRFRKESVKLFKNVFFCRTDFKDEAKTNSSKFTSRNNSTKVTESFLR